MKTRNLLVFCVSLITFTINLSAAVTVRQVWKPDNARISPNERVQFIQLQISTDEAVNLESLNVESVGMALTRSVFGKIAIRNGFDRAIGRAVPVADSTWITLERTVLLPEAPLFATLEGETLPIFAAENFGQSVMLVVKGVSVSGNEISIATTVGAGATHTVSREPSTVGKLTFVGKVGIPSVIRTGEMRFLGAFLVSPDSTEDISALMNIGVHTTGGGDNINNLRAVIITPKGWFLTSLYRSYEYDRRGDYDWGQYVIFSAGNPTYIGIFGDVGESLNGGTIAISTTPSEWKSIYGYKSGKLPAVSIKTVVGPTIQVLSASVGQKG